MSTGERGRMSADDVEALRESLEWAAIREDALRKAGNEWKARAEAAEAEVERLRDGLSEVNADIHSLERDLAVERARVARVEALPLAWARDYRDAPPVDRVLRKITVDLAAALADPAQDRINAQLDSFGPPEPGI